MERYQIDNLNRVAGFISQIGHESGKLRFLSENLNYSAEGLRKTFPKYFDASSAKMYERKPQMIASRVYANRMGNGDERSGEGWKYRGRGVIQITGKNNYSLCSNALGFDFISNPDAMAQTPWCVLSAGWYWDANRLNDYCDRGDLVGLTKRINGGTFGLDERIALYNKAISVLGC